MRLVSYLKDGAARFGAVRGDRVVEVGSDINTFIATPGPIPDGEGVPLADLALLPVVPNPGKIICIGLNYEEHKAEGVRNPADKPMLFARWPETLIGHQAPMVIPRISDKLDWEAEMLVVIGKPTGRYLPAAQALDHVFGYACMNEGSVRDWQRHSSQVTAGKNFEGTGAVGPYLVTADEIPDPQALEMELRVNGQIMQKTNTGLMIWSIAETIEYITNWISLNPGDVIATGTPAGVGSRRTPPIFLQAGDVVEVEIEGLGTLSNPVVKEA